MNTLPNFKTRTLSGLLFVLLLGGTILYPPVGVVFLSLLWCILLLEFLNITEKIGQKLSRPLMMTMGALGLALGIYSVLSMTYLWGGFGHFFTILYMIVIWILAAILLSPIVELFRKPSNAIAHVATSSYVLIYWGLAFLAMLLLMMTPITVFSLKINLLFLFLIFIWANDTFAYIGGCLFGKRLLYERLSPKKTVFGFISGLVMTLILAFVIQHWGMSDRNNEFMTPVFALVIVLFGTLGDLFESMLKRQANIKDSGSIIPGHGGVFDRMDSTLMAAFPAFIVTLLLYL